MAYHTSKTDMNNIFRGNRFSQKQKDKLGEILEILGRYIFIDRNILNARNIEPVKLADIQRAINYGLIVEIKDAEALNSWDGELDDNHYFYKLGVGGMNLLDLAGKKYYCFNILDTFAHREKVLIFNYHAIKNDLILQFSDYNDMKEYNYFLCKDNNNQDVICFHDDYITETKIISNMERNFISNLKNKNDIRKAEDLFYMFINKCAFEIIEPVKTTYIETLRNEYTLSNRLSDQDRLDSENDESNLKTNYLGL